MNTLGRLSALLSSGGAAFGLYYLTQKTLLVYRIGGTHVGTDTLILVYCGLLAGFAAAVFFERTLPRKSRWRRVAWVLAGLNAVLLAYWAILHVSGRVASYEAKLTIQDADNRAIAAPVQSAAVDAPAIYPLLTQPSQCGSAFSPGVGDMRTIKARA